MYDRSGEDQARGHHCDICKVSSRHLAPRFKRLTVGHRSSLVERVLLEAWASMQEEDVANKFHVVVVDSRPLSEGNFVCPLLRWNQ